jgi:endonuclease YncB( thermonuclease family)
MYPPTVKLATAALVALAAVGLTFGALSHFPTEPTDGDGVKTLAPRQEEQPPPAPPKVVPERVKDRGGEEWVRIKGPVKVIDARTLEFQDGTRVALQLETPYPDQMALDGDRLYPCGKEAAEYLRKLIGDKPVTCYGDGDHDRRGWIGYVGETSIAHAMVTAGWALGGHRTEFTDEFAAREGKRGLWRGKFIAFADWRAGLRLPGESPPPKLDPRRINELIGLGFDNEERGRSTSRGSSEASRTRSG